MLSMTLASLAFFNSRQGNASSGVYNFNGVLRSSFEFLIGFRTLFEFWIGFGTGRYVTTHNLISKPHFRVLRHWSLRDQSRTERSVRFGS